VQRYLKRNNVVFKKDMDFDHSNPTVWRFNLRGEQGSGYDRGDKSLKRMTSECHGIQEEGAMKFEIFRGEPYGQITQESRKYKDKTLR
jgi:hypothetical protein